MSNAVILSNKLSEMMDVSVCINLAQILIIEGIKITDFNIIDGKEANILYGENVCLTVGKLTYSAPALKKIDSIIGKDFLENFLLVKKQEDRIGCISIEKLSDDNVIFITNSEPTNDEPIEIKVIDSVYREMVNYFKDTVTKL